MDRRAFFKKSGQAAIFSGLALLSGYLMLRETPEGENCDFNFLCRDCSKNKACGLAQALDYRKKQASTR
jgi:hypothetical protein